VLRSRAPRGDRWQRAAGCAATSAADGDRVVRSRWADGRRGREEGAAVGDGRAPHVSFERARAARSARAASYAASFAPVPCERARGGDAARMLVHILHAC